MNQYNAIVKLCPYRLNFPLVTFHARLLRSFVVLFKNIPDDVTSVSVRVFTVGKGAFFDIPVGRRPDGTGVAYIIGTAFPSVGSSEYEVSGFDAKGNATALGTGLIEIEHFSYAGTPIQPGVPVVLDRIKDADGNYHTIKAVPDGDGGYTTIIDA